MIAEKTLPYTANQDEIETGAFHAAERRQRVRYLVLFCMLSIALYILPWLLLRLPSFEYWGGSGYGPVMDYAFQTNGQDADIVLYGDSSEVIGINPMLLSRQLGVKVVALPNTIGSLRLTGEMAMQHYLANNRPPKLIVLYVAPWNLNYSHEESKFLLFEGEEMLFRHGSLPQIFAFFKTHPADTLLFPLRLYEVNPKVASVALLKHLHPSESAAATRGHYDPLYMVPPFVGSCKLPKKMIQDEAFDSARSFLDRYTTPSTKVLVYNAPIPACSNASILENRSYAAVQAAPPKLISPADYKADEYYIHLEPTGVDQATAYLRDAIASHFDVQSFSVPGQAEQQSASNH